MLGPAITACQKLLELSLSGSSSNQLFHGILKSQINLLTENLITEKFFNYFKEEPKKHSFSSLHLFLEAVEILELSCDNVDRLTDSQDLKNKLMHELRTQIALWNVQVDIKKYINAAYNRDFKIFLNIEKKQKLADKQTDIENRMEVYGDGDEPDELSDGVDDEDDEIVDDDNDLDNDAETESSHDYDLCPGCQHVSCMCEYAHRKFRQANESLRRLGLLGDIIDETIINVSRVFIEKKVAAKGKSNYSYSYIDDLTVWVDCVMKKWINDVCGPTKQVDYINQKLDRYLKEAYADVRVAHLFEIIIEYPNSDAAIQDLKMCLDQSTSYNFRLTLIESLKQSLVESLLHPGVNTYDILTAYISAIKALRALDPTGLILQLVTEPVRRYLKERDDTVRCIVTALTDEEHNSELNREMIQSGSQTNENGMSPVRQIEISGETERPVFSTFEAWKPDPIKVSSTDDPMKSNRFSDIVSILVNIYESKDLFVEEYQKLLSQRLLNKYDECNIDTELRNLELLTIRFSDCELHRCEVMLKDVQTSKRINKRILSEDVRDHKLEQFKNLDVLIVSSPFWPSKFSPTASLSDDPPEIRFAPEIESAIETYTRAFETIQASRTLHWRHHLGFVDMDVEIGGKKQNVIVSPLHASLLYLFKEKTSWRLCDIMHRTSLPAAVIRSRMERWQSYGLIRLLGEDRYDLAR